MAACTQCGTPYDSYSAKCRPHRVDWCRRCLDVATRRRYRQSEKGRATCRAHAARHRQTERGRALIRANRRRYYQSARGRLVKRANQKRYAQSDSGRVVARRAQERYYQTDDGRAGWYRNTRKRRARQRGATILERVERRMILKLDDHLCHLCDMPVDTEAFDIDHLIPLAVMPIEAAWNSAAAHPSCNRQKGPRIAGHPLTPTARARWERRRPAHLAELDAHVARIVASREEAAA
jgi:5-methylcytosine-specific restriction endonuclease McrA